MKGKTIVYCAALAVVLTLTVYLFVRNLDARRELPDTPESAKLYLCEKCGLSKAMTPREVDEATAERNRLSSQVLQTDLAVRKMMMLPCPACKEMAVISARECPTCKKPFSPVTTDGTRHELCKDCEKAAAPPVAKTPAPGK